VNVDGIERAEQALRQTVDPTIIDHEGKCAVQAWLIRGVDNSICFDFPLITPSLSKQTQRRKTR
ncbi:MAG: hypothetical protein QXM22_04210, partial [Candidatus Bathyarchaeia archaeon]